MNSVPRVENSSAHQFSMSLGEPKEGPGAAMFTPAKSHRAGGAKGGFIPTPTCPRPSSPAQQPGTWARCHRDSPDLHFRLLQSLTMVVMKAHVIWPLFKQGLRILNLCREHNQPLGSAGHCCSAGSLRSMPKCAGSCMRLCPSAGQRLLCQMVFFAPQQPRCSRVLCSIVTAPPAGMASLLCTTTEDLQDPQPTQGKQGQILAACPYRVWF